MAVDATLLPDWTTERLTCTAEHGYRFYARYQIEPDHCPICGSAQKPYKHEPTEREYVDAPSHGKPARLIVSTMRYRCREPECRKTFMQSLPDIDADREMTQRCVEFIREQSVFRTLADVARMLNVDEKTVRNIANDEIERFTATYTPFPPVVLGIDEVTINDQRRTVMVDVGDRRILDMLPDMDRSRVAGWLYSLKRNRRIRIVTMDMWKDYRTAVREVLPNVTIVVDKWHTIAKANDVLDIIRNEQRRNSKSRKNPHKGRRLLQTGRHNLSAHRAFILDGVLKNNPRISAAWHCKEAFYDIWGHKDRPSRQDAEARFAKWRNSIPEEVSQFRSIAEMIDRWYEETFAYFDTPFTNAYTEAANGLIKIASRSGRGYRLKAIRMRAIRMPVRGKKRFTVCEDCLKPYPVVERLTSRDQIYVLDAEHWPVRCGHCREIHVNGYKAALCDSPPKSG